MGGGDQGGDTIEALIFFFLAWTLGAWLDGKAKEFGEFEQRMLLQGENATLRLALADAQEAWPDPSEREARIEAQFRARDPPGRV